MKRGLHKDYVGTREEIPTVRGRIDVAETSARLASTRGYLVCEFDEYSADVPHNRAIKAAMTSLMLSEDVSYRRRRELDRMLRHFHHVDSVPLRTVEWTGLQYHRSNAAYRTVMQICELLAQGLLPADSPGDALVSWMADDAMNDLFERFIRSFFDIHFPHLGSSSKSLAWDFSGISAGLEQLPGMYTDISLFDGHRHLIIDTKFYSSAMQRGRWEKSTLHSANLYQLFTYVKNADTRQDGSVSGLLLYAKTDADEHPELDMTVQDNRLGATAVDLSSPWPELRQSIVDLLDRW